MKIPISSSPKIEPALNVATTEAPILIILLNMALNYLTPNLLNRKWVKDFCLTPILYKGTKYPNFYQIFFERKMTVKY
jgi:hypothetical protein